MDCSICLEPIKEEQPKKKLDSCCHEFHEDCLNPWLICNSTCPNCRNAIRPPTELTPQQRTQQQRELDRLYLTYILYSWILQEFSGVRFRNHTDAIHSFVESFSFEGMRPILFRMTPQNRGSLSSIRTLRGYLIQRESHLFHEVHPTAVHRALHRNPRVCEMSRQISSQLNLFRQSHA